MSFKTVSLRRSFFSYAKVQAWVAPLLRNRSFQLRRPCVLAACYLDVGCGRNHHVGFAHLDYLWHPGVDVCWDIARGLPFSDGAFKGVFSQHCLEHFSLGPALAQLREMRRVLAPGGTARIVVPDGELYLRAYFAQLTGAAEPRFPYQDADGFSGIRTPMLSVNRIFYVDRESSFGHRTIYDCALLSALMLEAGFTSVAKCRYGEGRDPQLMVDSPDRRVESLYLEGSA